MNDLDVAILNRQGGIRPTTMSRERIALLKIAKVIKEVEDPHIIMDRTELMVALGNISIVLTRLGVLSGK